MPLSQSRPPAGTVLPGVRVTTPGTTRCLAGTVPATSSAPDGVVLSSQVSARIAETTPPVAITCTTGECSPGARASSRTTLRRWAPTTRPRPAAAVSWPFAPYTSSSTVTPFGVGLVSMTRPRRPGASLPPTSQVSAEGAWQAEVDRPRRSPPVTSEVCRRPGRGRGRRGRTGRPSERRWSRWRPRRARSEVKPTGPDPPIPAAETDPVPVAAPDPRRPSRRAHRSRDRPAARPLGSGSGRRPSYRRRL